MAQGRPGFLTEPRRGRRGLARKNARRAPATYGSVLARTQRGLPRSGSSHKAGGQLLGSWSLRRSQGSLFLQHRDMVALTGPDLAVRQMWSKNCTMATSSCKFVNIDYLSNKPMKASVLASVLLLAMPEAFAAEPGTAPAPVAARPLRARLTDEAIKQAVRETLAESGERPAAAGSGDVLSGDRYQPFSRGFTEARKPSCLGPDALKHQPASVSTKNWNFSAGALLALPFWAAAIARGKCN